MSDDEYSEQYPSDREEEDDVPFSKPIRSKKVFTGDVDDADDADAEDDLDAEAEADDDLEVDPDAEDDIEVDDAVNPEDDIDFGEDSEEDEMDEDDGDEENRPDEDIMINEEKVKEKKKVTKKKKVQVLHFDDDDDDIDTEDNYLQKFNNDIKHNYINEFHPECLTHNYDEISRLSIVIRNEDGIIVDPLHKTIPYLTKYERARILGQRAKQIEMGSRPFVNVPENIVDTNFIAELELSEKKIPFIIKRPKPDGSCEYWKVQDLELIIF